MNATGRCGLAIPASSGRSIVTWSSLPTSLTGCLRMKRFALSILVAARAISRLQLIIISPGLRGVKLRLRDWNAEPMLSGHARKWLNDWSCPTSASNRRKSLNLTPTTGTFTLRYRCTHATPPQMTRCFRLCARESDVILAVPCCQHELAAKIARDSLPAVLRHGILNDRFCAITTDAVRAALLERVGWQTRVVEFIDMEHTAKNVLIRAIRRRSAAPTNHVARRLAELRQLHQTFALPPLRLERQLTEAGLLSSVYDEDCGRRNAE